MKLDTFFEKFALFAEAPGAVGTLRELVRDLAVRGQLTTGLNSDGSESHWQTLPLREVADYRAAIKVNPDQIPADTWLLDLEEIEKDSGRIIEFRSFQEKSSKSTKAAFAAGDVLYGKLRPYLNKVLVAPKAGFCTTEIVPIRPRANITPEYLCLFLRSPRFLRYAVSKSYGMKMPRLGTADAESAEIQLPPLAEQKRIVAKVDELTALCDRLEAQQQERETQHAALSRAALARFAEDPTPANLEWLFHASFSTPTADLRQSVLTLAVQGKLVPRNNGEESAAQSFPQLASEAIPFENDEFPAHWLRVPLGNIGQWYGGGTPSKSRQDFWSGSIPWISPKDMKTLHIADGQDHISHAALEASTARLIPEGSLLMVVRGMILARAFPVALTRKSVAINQDMKAISPNEPAIKDFLLLALQAFELHVLSTVEHSSHGTCKLQTKILHDLVVPLPPLPEQRRIVAKVDELMALVDQLETRQTAARAAATRLLDAAVAELTA